MEKYLVVMNVIVGANHVYAIITTKIGTPDGKMVCFYIDGKAKHYMELWAVDQDQVMDRRIYWRDQTNKTGAISAV